MSLENRVIIVADRFSVRSCVRAICKPQIAGTCGFAQRRRILLEQTAAEQWSQVLNSDKQPAVAVALLTLPVRGGVIEVVELLDDICMH